MFIMIGTAGGLFSVVYSLQRFSPQRGGDCLVDRHRPPLRPRRRERLLAQRGMGGSHVAVVVGALVGRQGSTDRLAEGFGGAEEPGGALRLVVVGGGSDAGQAFQA